jgi:hypothetical protein
MGTFYLVDLLADIVEGLCAEIYDAIAWCDVVYVEIFGDDVEFA